MVDRTTERVSDIADSSPVMPSSLNVWLVEHPTQVDEFASRFLRRRGDITQTTVSSIRMP
jgi:hypothetical protein